MWHGAKLLGADAQTEDTAVAPTIGLAWGSRMHRFLRARLKHGPAVRPPSVPGREQPARLGGVRGDLRFQRIEPGEALLLADIGMQGHG